jgi:hypothetical protein
VQAARWSRTADGGGHRDRLLAKIGSHVVEGFSVSPDRKTILFSRSATYGNNLMMIENLQ